MDTKFTKKRGIIYLTDNQDTASFKQAGVVVGHYQPNIITAEQGAQIHNKLDELFEQLHYNRVMYISPYSKINCTPRMTWAYGVSPQEVPKGGVGYRKLNFQPEAMPDWLQELALTCRNIAIEKRGFDPEYNSCIIGLYTGGEDQIDFHTDAETFLKTTFCANVTIGDSRDFHFKFGPKDNMKTYGIELADRSLFLFDSLEHKLPQRKAMGSHVRYSISFRNMANNIGIGNSYYYCRGLLAATDDDVKREYVDRMRKLYDEGKKAQKITSEMFETYINQVSANL